MSATTATLQVRRYSHGKRAKAFAKELTPRQAQVLAFMREFFLENDQLPPVTVVAEHFGYKSAGAAQYYVDALVLMGKLEKNELGRLRFARPKTEEAAA